MRAPPAKEKNDRKNDVAANEMERPNTIWSSRRKPPPMSPKARLRPVIMMVMTAMILATGPSTDSKMRCSGASQGMPEPAACNALASVSAAAATSQTRRTLARLRGSLHMPWAPCAVNGVQDWCRVRFQHVVAVAIDTIQFGDRFDAPLVSTTAKEHHDVDGLDDQTAWHRDDGFLDQQLEP